ncbi:hypothetical protein [Brevundimonas sp. GCM10030266]|uniref:hypothetical protein n=1 Tax=Brevundimonas sp. GCM10030266 TaxID=3273386 RepID=UPI00360B9322
MSALDLCQYESVELTRRCGLRPVKAYRYGLLCAHRSVNERGFVISHVPTGLTLTNRTGVFTKIEKAAEAMVEIAALTNDWLNLDADDLSRLSEPVKAIGAKHGGDLNKRRVFDQGDIASRANRDLTARFI